MKKANRKMMKIVLVFPPFFLESMYNLPPLGLINLATALQSTDHEVVILDFVLSIRQHTLEMGKHIYDQCAERILAQVPDLVGFSAQCTTYPAVIQIAGKVKAEKPDTRIVLGGHNASFVDQATLERFPFVDAIVRGEGEIAFKDLVENYASGKEGEGILGVTCRCGRRVVRNGDRELIPDLDSLPLPDYTLAPSLAAYRDACRIPRSIAILEVGRGCPHRCIYCSESILWRRRTRTFSVNRLVQEMKNLHQNFGAQCFLLAYDQFTSNRGFVESFCHRVIEEGMNQVPWYCISRLDSVDGNLLSLMRKAGCESMCYGIDSGSKRTLAFIRKNIPYEILYERVVETAEQGIIPTLSFVIGFPEEEKEDIDATLRMALRTGIVGNNNPLIQMPTVLPGTELAERYRHRLVRQVDTYFSLGLEFDSGRRLESDEALINSDSTVFSSFYNLPCAGRSLEELNLLAEYFPMMVQFYPKTFLLLSLECDESVSDLFIRWLHWLRAHQKRKRLTASPQDCYQYFRVFVTGLLGEKKEIKIKHLPDILKYENLGLEVGKFDSLKDPFHIDLDGLRELRPIRNKKMIIETFDFNVSAITSDLKSGDYKGSYAPQSTLLLFRQEGDVLDVVEINPFTKDFLELCDGQATLESISTELYHRYGEEMNLEAFFQSCVEAVQILGEQGLLKSA